MITCDAMQNEEIVDDLRFDEKNIGVVQQPIHKSHQQIMITFVYIKPIWELKIIRQIHKQFTVWTKIHRISLHLSPCNGSFTPPETETDTDIKYTERNENLCCHLSLCSVNTST